MNRDTDARWFCGFPGLSDWGRSALLACLLGWAAVAGAAETGKPAPAAEPVVSAPVIIDGEELFRVRGVRAYPAEKRAVQIQQRIRAMAENPALTAAALTLTEVPEGTRIAAGDQFILTVFDADARLEQADRQPLARIYAKRVGEAVEAYRNDRTSASLLRSAGYVLAATLALGVFLWLGRFAVRRIDRTLDGRVKAGLSGIEARSMKILSAAHLWRALHVARRFAWSAATLIAGVFYLDFVLHQFPWTRLLAARLWTLLIEPLRSMGAHILATIPDLAFLAVLIFVVRYVLKAIRLFFEALAQGDVPLTNFEREWAWPTYRLVRLMVVAFALVVAYPYIPGSGSDAFKGISLFLGVIFSLGSSSVISNVIAGYSMIYRRAFRVGDRVRIEDQVGDVTEARLLVTHLRTPKNEEVVIPNSLILNTSVVNYSTMAREGRLILYATVGIGYETPWRQVEAMLLLAAGRSEGLLKEPQPFVLQKQLGDFAVTYEINVYCGDAQAMSRLYTELYRNILDVFNEYGVQIMTPAYEGDPEQPKLVSRDQWYPAPAAAPADRSSAAR
jgi:small-conductance mechanosensitive channel